MNRIPAANSEAQPAEGAVTSEQISMVEKANSEAQPAECVVTTEPSFIGLKGTQSAAFEHGKKWDIEGQQEPLQTEREISVNIEQDVPVSIEDVPDLQHKSGSVSETSGAEQGSLETVLEIVRGQLCGIAGQDTVSTCDNDPVDNDLVKDQAPCSESNAETTHLQTQQAETMHPQTQPINVSEEVSTISCPDEGATVIHRLEKMETSVIGQQVLSVPAPECGDEVGPSTLNWVQNVFLSEDAKNTVHVRDEVKVDNMKLKSVAEEAIMEEKKNKPPKLNRKSQKPKPAADKSKCSLQGDESDDDIDRGEILHLLHFYQVKAQWESLTPDEVGMQEHFRHSLTETSN